jgi:hypothetical protein
VTWHAETLHACLLQVRANTEHSNYFFPESLTTGVIRSKFELKLIQKRQDFISSKTFVSAGFEFVKFPTRYEWSIITGTVQE